MTEKRKPISDGATFEDVQALLLKAARQLRTMAPPAHVLVTLDQIEADVEQMRAAGRRRRLSFDASRTDEEILAAARST